MKAPLHDGTPRSRQLSVQVNLYEWGKFSFGRRGSEVVITNESLHRLVQTPSVRTKEEAAGS